MTFTFEEGFRKALPLLPTQRGGQPATPDSHSTPEQLR